MNKKGLHRKLTLAALMVAFVALLAACGGGGSSAVVGPGAAPATGTPAVAAGVMTVGGLPTGATTVVVGGVSMATTATTTVTINGVAATPADLADGMVVRVVGTVDANGTQGTATEIAAEDTLNGTVTAVALNGDLTVLGQTVVVGPTTVIVDDTGAPAAAPIIGDKIQVFGARDNSVAANGNIFASRIVVGALVVDAGTGRAVGPTDAVNGYPTFFRDETGLALDLCDDAADLRCLADPVQPANPLSVAIGFGAEAFWWMGEAITPTAAGQALLVQAVEAAWLNENPAPGDQIAFSRLRIRVDTSSVGTHTVTHPYGVNTFEIAIDAGTGLPEPINDTIDIGCLVTPCTDFTPVLTGPTFPLLTWDPAVLPLAPVGFIGDPAVEHPVVGSPTGNNFFRVDGPNIGGPGVNTVQTNNFVVVGRIFTDIVKIDGVVEGLLGTTFTIGGLTVDFTGVTVVGGIVANGARVEVQGVSAAPGTMTAMSVAVVPPTPDQLVVVGGELINAEGFITGFVDLTTHQTLTAPFMLGDIPVNTSATTVVLGVPANGARAMARGSFVAGSAGPPVIPDAFIADEIIIFGAAGATVLPQVTLLDDNEVPALTTPVPAATGNANLNFDPGTGVLTGTINFSGLSGPATAAHIHQGAAGVAGGIVIFLTGDLGAPAGTLTVPFGTVLSPALVTALQADQLYVNIHTAANPGGEIRGQITFPPAVP